MEPIGRLRTLLGVDDADDTALWQRSTAGDGEAFALIFDRHHPRVHRHAHRLTADRHDAEDLTAGAFLELWRRRDRVRLVDGSVLPWLLVTTSNLARNHARGLRRHHDFLARLDHAPRTHAGADEDAWSEGDGSWARALAQLNGPDLRLVTLVVLEEHSLASAAALLGLTPQAVKSRLHRARQRLRAAMSHADPAGRSLEPGMTATTTSSTTAPPISARTLGEQR